MSNDSKDNIGIYFIKDAKGLVFDLSHGSNLGFGVGRGLAMKVFDFDSNVLEFVIVEVVARLTEYSSVAESIFGLAEIYLSIRL